MVSIYDVEPRKLIEVAAKQLEKMPEMAPPEWAAYVKTGRHRERPPVEVNWWYIRSAAVLRSVYKLGPIGVSKLKTKYGGRKNRGHKPDKTFKASGNILRKILQKLELIGYLKQAEKGVHKGRIVTPQGKSFMDKIVVKIKKPYKKPVKGKPVKEKKPVVKAEKVEVGSEIKKETPVEKKEAIKEKKQPEKKSEKEKTKKEVKEKPKEEKPVEIKKIAKEEKKPEVKKEVKKEKKPIEKPKKETKANLKKK